MKCRIYKNEPTSEQRKALKAECVKEFNKLLSEYNYQVAVQVLYILRFDYGFGQERLNKFAEKLSQMQINLENTYEMGEDNTWWLCEHKLKESGIDLERILK